MIPFCLRWNVKPCVKLYFVLEAASTEYMERGKLLFGHLQFPRTLDARYGDTAVFYPRLGDK